jgi:site-specific recombinase XerD
LTHINAREYNARKGNQFDFERHDLGGKMPRHKRHPGTIEARGDSLRIILYAAGERHAFTLPTRDRREAVEFAQRKHLELQGGVGRVRRGLPGRTPVSALFDKFEAERLPHLAPNTQKTYRLSISTFRQFFAERLGDPTVSEIRSGNVADYLAWRRVHRKVIHVNPDGTRTTREEGQVGARTLQKDRACLHAVFAFAEELEFRDGNPVSRVTPPRAEKRTPVILDEDQYAALLRACEDRPMLSLYVTALGEAGLRCDSEALRLQWEDVDLEEGFLWIDSGRDGHRTKSGKGRWVPMTPKLRQSMREHFARFRFATYNGERTPWVFHHTTTRRRAAVGGRIAVLRRAFEGAVSRANLPANLHQHDLRHRRVTTWLAAGADAVKVKEAMGHADLRTTMDYTHLVRNNLRSLVEPGEHLRVAR